MSAYFTSEQLVKIQRNRYTLYFFIAIFFVLPMLMVATDTNLLKAVYYTKNGSVSTDAQLVHFSRYQGGSTITARGGRTYDIEYRFTVPNQEREFSGRDRIVSSGEPAGIYKVEYNPANPAFNRLETPYYTNGKIYASLAVFGLSILCSILAVYCVYNLSFSRVSLWLLAIGYGSLFILFALLAYIL